MATYGDAAQTAIAFAMNSEFSPVLQTQMDLYNSPSADQFAQVHRKLDDVKNVMVQNIEMVLERGEKLELLVDKTDQLNATAFTFEKSSRKLKEAMFWKKVKVYMLALSLVGFIIFVITWVACVLHATLPIGTSCVYFIGAALTLASAKATKKSKPLSSKIPLGYTKKFGCTSCSSRVKAA